MIQTKKTDTDIQLTEEERCYRYALHRTGGIGGVAIRRLLEAAGDAYAAWLLPEQELAGVLNRAQTDAILYARSHRQPEADYARLEAQGIRFLTIDEAGYPEKLRQIPDPPYAIYIRGTLPDPATPAVAIIGARLCSEYGRLVARQFGRGLAESGVQVISGMARGIDGVGQWAALQAGGRSFGVLGCGVDICYPEENEELYRLLCREGGVLSEVPPGTRPEARLFPPRNRIISALSDAVLVVEARARSGTLITVDMALEQGREVFAVPGRICDRLSDGCAALIRQGAQIALSPQDVVDHLRRERLRTMPSLREAEEGEDVPASRFSGLVTGLQEELLGLLDLTPVTVDDLEDRLSREGRRVPVPELLNALVELCLMGAASQQGGRFALQNG
ncbi:MAG: DNA-processing protein DprA [Butyrivibrio sp.]|nr:DNA-processing protein DprA [Butyrivibrio sp.]